MIHRICKTFKFEAAHRLPNHDGKCRNLHGHSYIVEVELEGSVEMPDTRRSPKEGMICDFGDLKRIFNERVFNRYDHTFLNESMAGLLPESACGQPITTAENQAVLFLSTLQEGFKAAKLHHVKVSRVRVWETATSWAEAIA